MESKWEQVKVENGTMGLFVSRPDGEGPFPGIVVAQHREGIDGFVKEMTNRLALMGYVAVAPEIYHRDGPDCQDEGPTRANRLQDPTVMVDINASVDFLKGLPYVRANRIGIVGFCQGGRVAYLMAGVNPEFKVCVSYYGGGLFAARGGGPSPFERTPQINCPVLGHFGTDDVNPSPDDVRKLDAELTKYGKAHDFYSYSGAGHAFMNFDAESYRADADRISWPRTLEFLKKYL